MTTDYLLVNISLSGLLSVVMVNDYSDFQHNYFSLTKNRFSVFHIFYTDYII